MGSLAFCLTTTDCPARGGVTRDTDRWVHLSADQEPTTPPNVAHGNSSNTIVVVQTPPRPKKQRKVCSRADIFVPTTTRTTRSGCRNKPPPPKDGGYLSERDSTPEERYTKNDPTPRRRLEGTGLQAWMDDRHICVYQEVVWCMREVLEPRAWSQALAWCDNLEQRVDKCDRLMSPNLHWWQRSFFFMNSDCSSGVHWFVLGVVVELAMHVCLWDAKGSQLYMRPLIQ